ncbi:CD1375 family protein [Paenibacillus illinoisensis]|uniref:CD1375 family protein n=1 Tax=Paenibacillus illinoisensis TaxID=59845 RepID=UPI000FDABAA8|nr:CD1375 family protein [Paenibacillus illinoisensis]
MRLKLARLLIRWALLLVKGGETMLAVYVALIHKGVIKLEAVPTGSREKVAEALEAAGMDQNGNIA